MARTKEVLIITKQGRAIKIKLADFPIQLRRGVGIKAISVRQGDEVAAVMVA